MTLRRWKFAIETDDRAGYLLASGDMVPNKDLAEDWIGTDLQAGFEADRRADEYEEKIGGSIERITYESQGKGEGMKKLFTVLLLLVLMGCEPQSRAWESALTTHVCTKEQMEKAQAEAVFCGNNTSYLTTYCYGTAIIRNCKERRAIP